jgi:glucokinase
MSQPMVTIAFPKRLPLKEGGTLLAIDVGGTKTDLAFVEVRNGEIAILKEEVYPSKEYTSLVDLIRKFNGTKQVPERLSIAFAGPVQDGKAFATNLGWSIDTRQLSADTNIPKVFLINDLEAEAYGLAALKEEDVRTIYPGHEDSKGNAAIIAPGTGLGEAGLFWDGAALHPFATEGGHCNFAPDTTLDWELYQYLHQKFGHVSWERLLSGPGICNIFDFLHEVKHREVPVWLDEKLKTAERAAVIGETALEGCPISVETMEIFVRYLAIESSNLALKLSATGGVFIGGGIPAKIWNEHLQAIFLEHFLQVGRLRSLVEQVPVRLVLNPKAVLLGAVYFGKA